MTVDPRLAELAQRTPNFGFLLEHEAVLVGYGAAAESMIFTDPNTSMIKARQFGEQLVTALVATFSIRIPAGQSTQHKRLKVLLDQGVINQRVHTWFDAVRDTGNKAVHDGFAAQRDALQLVRTCYDLGAWFHRTVTQSRDAPPFVSPQPPARTAPPRDQADAVALTELNDQLGSYHAELIEMRLRLDEQASLAAAEAQARRDAEAEILAAVRGQGDLHRLVSELSSKVEELGRDLTQRAETPPRLDPARRDAMVEQAQIASRPPLSEVQVRRVIDRMLAQAGWVVQDVATTNLQVAMGVAVREVTMARGRADYLLYVDGALVGVIEAKREGVSLIGAEQQSDRYAVGLTTQQQVAAWHTPLPFRYESTGVETRFTNGLDPVPRSRRVFAFHQPVTIARWIREANANPQAPTLRSRLGQMPELITHGLRPNQIEAITGLEESLAADRPRALIQMATGAGKTYTVVNASYRLLKHAGARRVLFLVDRNNLGKQARAEYARFETPDDFSKFAELYNVQRLTSTTLLDSASVVISTVQRLYAMLRGQELPADDGDPEFDDYDSINEAVELEYNAAIPPETFDLIVVDECHRSIYGKWRAVLEYFDAHIVGLTATPVAQTFGFFHENLVSQYTSRQAVADGVNVDFQIMRISTQVGEHGGSIPAHIPVRVMDLHTRRERYEQLDTALDYRGDQIGRAVMNPSQIRIAIQAFADGWPEYFPHREHVPKTLIFAKTDLHADQIVIAVREIFGGGNEFCTKITYRSDDPEQALKDFRTKASTRVAVTVDMIATGTDVRPLECVFFLRGVSSATYFEQMKGRGARTVDADEFQTVTPDAAAKTKFLLVDAVGVTDSPLVEAKPLQPASQRQVSLQKLLAKAASHGITTDEAAALSARLSALNGQITESEREELAAAGGRSLHQLAKDLAEATDDDAQEQARLDGGAAAQHALVVEAVAPLADPDFRARILSIRRKYDLPFDEHTHDVLISVEARTLDRDGAHQTVEDWRAYLEENRDLTTALRVAFSEPRRDPGAIYAQLTDLARQIERPPHQWTPAVLWDAYRKLGIAHGNGGRKGVPELISILRYELGLRSEVEPYHSLVEQQLANWLARQEQAGVRFTVDQRWFIDRIANVIASRLHVDEEALDDPPFTQNGGADGFCQAFGDEDRAAALLAELNKELPA
ncbi:MAG: DEAD/DEAH box helicase family protein [Pseudonocardiaceae bacterium]